MTTKKEWKMPDWMEQYRELFHNTGGNSVEDLYNDDGTNSNVFNNAVRGMLCVGVKSQVALLNDLHRLGILPQQNVYVLRYGIGDGETIGAFTTVLAAKECADGREDKVHAWYESNSHGHIWKSGGKINEYGRYVIEETSLLNNHRIAFLTSVITGSK